MTCKKRIVLTDAVRKKKLGKLLEDYLAECRPPPDADPKHSGGSFPNLAGFCSYLGCGIDEFEALRTTDPATADYLSAALEDAALNRSPCSPPPWYRLISNIGLGTGRNRRRSAVRMRARFV